MSDARITLAELAAMPVTRLTGVGARKAEGLAVVGVETLLDLLTYYPRRYVDRTKEARISDLAVGEEALVIVTVERSSSRRTRGRPPKVLVTVEVTDGSGRLRVTFFNQAWRERQLQPGMTVALFGKLELFGGRRQMTNPVVDLIGNRTGRIVPIYPQSDKAGLSTWEIGDWVAEALRRSQPRGLADPVPEWVLDRYDLVSRPEAFAGIHAPESMAHRDVARRRLVLDELLRVQLALVQRKRHIERTTRGLSHATGGPLLGAFVDRLPFDLTDDQRAAMAEIGRDLAAPHPMHRLLQGDVGAGKAQPLRSLVLTPSGFQRMGDLVVGDDVLTPSGEITQVSGVFPQGVRDVWRLHLSDGTTVDCDDEHLWVVNTSVGRSRGRPPKTVTTRYLREHLLEKNGASRWHIERATAAEFDDHGHRPLDPYLLGALLGDGTFRAHIAFSSGDSDIVDAVDRLLPEGCFLKQSTSRRFDHFIRCSFRHTQDRPHPVAKALEDLGLSGRGSHDKFVPESYLSAPVKDRHALLQGLLDTDGTLSRHGRDVSFTSASLDLALDVRWLVASLGGIATMKPRLKSGGRYYHVSIRLPPEFAAFRLERKARLLRPTTKYANPARAIREITFVGREPMQCISVANPSQMYVTDGFVPTHNTVVAVWTLLAAVQGGHQGAFMAPTEVLAEQHAQGIRALLDGVEVPDSGTSLFGARPVRAELLTNKVGAADRRRILAGLAAGEVDIAIGTHALIQEGVEFRSLGAAVIDEQHRFGVEQRAALRDKAGGGPVPDVLVMTATPIPRTAAMTVYGDLDVTVIRSLPAGRQPIVTTWARTEVDEAEVWAAVRREVTAGRQAYVVTPLIEESDKLEVRSAEDTFARLEAGELAGLRLGLLHGRLGGADKEATMHQFRAGRLDVLVATTVIEVGVDVPNATVMVVLDADRFGIAQLHQLRGRVGRGSEQSWCYLVSASDSDEAEARLGALVRSTDGFALAEVDLDLRGEGTIMGERQKGRSDLKLASLRRDRPWVERAREVAFAIVDGDGLDAHPDLAEELTLFLDEEEQEFLLKG
jgi:ATP-dependent DNA helicase RecG